MKKSKKKVWIVSGVGVVLLLVIFANIFRKDDSQIQVEFEEVKLGNIVHKVNASGKIQPVKEIKISATTSALIKAIYVKEGEQVVADQLLITLDEKQHKAAVDQARSSVNSGEANVKQIKAQKERNESLYKQKLISDQEIEAIRAQYEMAVNQLKQAKAALDSREDELSKLKMVAPTDGIVTRVNKEVGEMAVGSMFQAEGLMTVADLTKMEVEVDVNENDVISVSVGDTAEIEVDAFQDTVFYGIVSEIAQVAETSNFGTQEQVTNFKVKVKFISVHPQIRPGMSANTNIITDIRNNVRIIPIQCLTIRPEGFDEEDNSDQSDKTKDKDDSNQKFKSGADKKEMIELVFIVSDTIDTSLKMKKKTKPPYAFAKPIKVGLSSETHYEVLSGLSVGERIITGSFKAISRELKHNIPVTISE